MTYGAGNMPTNRPDILAVLDDGCRRGVVIVNVTQCKRGHVEVSYETGQHLARIGVIGGADMTPECAFTKLAFVLGHDDWDTNKRRQMMCKNMRGEMTLPLIAKTPSAEAAAGVDLLNGLAKYLSAHSSAELTALKSTLYAPLACDAASREDVHMLTALKEAGANLSALDYDNRSALHVAAHSGRARAVEYLLHAGLSVHACDRWGMSALECAVLSTCGTCVELIVSAGGSIHFKAPSLSTYLCSAAAGNHVNMLTMWRLAGADMNAADYDGRTALHVAAARNNRACVEYLLSLNDAVDKYRLDNYGHSARDCALARNYAAVAELLL